MPIAYDGFSFPSEKFTHAESMVAICDIVQEVMVKYNVAAVFIEEIQFRKNIDSFKKLARLQGSLISLFERNEYLYDFIPPSRWQNFCNARGRTSKEVKERSSQPASSGKKQSKLLSIQFAKEQFGIDTTDDNLADAICIGYFVACNINIEYKEKDL
jgi:Holliday junction resolvasome RuvABC endonuclease subunit